MAIKQRHKSPCDNKCGARGKLHRVTFVGRKLDLCQGCLKALRKIPAERERTETESSEREPAIDDVTTE